MNHNSTPLLRGNAPIPQPISPSCGSPSHWNHHSSQADCGPSQLHSHDYVHTSNHTLRRSSEHRGIPLHEEPCDRFPHHLLPSLGQRSTRHNSSGHGLSCCMSSRPVFSSCMVMPCLCPCLGDFWGGVRGCRVQACWSVV